MVKSGSITSMPSISSTQGAFDRPPVATTWMRAPVGLCGRQLRARATDELVGQADVPDDGAAAHRRDGVASR